MFSNIQSPLLQMLLAQQGADQSIAVPDRPNAPALPGKGIMPGSLQQILASAASKAGVPVEWANSPSLYNLLKRESSFNPNAQNPKSTAYGLFQFLDSTWKGTGIKKTSDPLQQSIAGLRYIKNRYGDPNRAWDFWQSNKWY